MIKINLQDVNSFYHFKTIKLYWLNFLFIVYIKFELLSIFYLLLREKISVSTYDFLHKLRKNLANRIFEMMITDRKN
ncbi:hypothetical protein D7I46_00560 [Lactococcus allomyrinae]|uniref:Uncharacterized protein n=1 Tax=Lactococcus allomyrinae TaxID=2419773 RepID=A0A387B7R2_9LACT|nr:hypothetical protein D7I46_00560 [Lactococcus allomyrinae]